MFLGKLWENWLNLCGAGKKGGRVQALKASKAFASSDCVNSLDFSETTISSLNKRLWSSPRETGGFLILIEV